MAISEADLLAADAFLADENKLLFGSPTPWVAHHGEWQQDWIIVESDGRQRASLRFRCGAAHLDWPSINLIFRGHPLCRLDREPPTVCHPNLPGAAKLGLPPEVCGTHFHGWAINRAWVAKNGRWELPYRDHAPEHMRDLDHMFYWFLRQVRVSLGPDQRGYVSPPDSLF